MVSAMLFGGRPQAKLHRRVERLRRKGKLEQALELQRELCNLDPEDRGEWEQLAEIAEACDRLDVALAAQFEATKLHPSTTVDDWQRLAQRASSAGFTEDAVEALFRAADRAATTGDAPRALVLFDQVLQLSPHHRQARRIRSLVAARMESVTSGPPDVAAGEIVPDGSDDTTTDVDDEAVTQLRDGAAGATGPHRPASRAAGPTGPQQPAGAAASASGEIAEQDDQDDDERESSISWVTGPAHLADIADDGGDLPLDELTSPEWQPPIDLESDVGPTVAGYVLAPQAWPSVLDEQSLLFVGELQDVDASAAELSELGKPVTVNQGATVLTQGRPTEVLYCLEEGRLSLSRERGGHQDLGELNEGTFFGELGALIGLPSTTCVQAKTRCRLRVVSREAVQQRAAQGSVPPLVRMLRAWYVETVAHVCPLIDEEQLDHELEWASFGPAENISIQGIRGPLHVIVTGLASVMLAQDTKEVGRTLDTFLPSAATQLRLGYLCPGDTVGEIDPSPVTVVADTAVSALRLPREIVERLPSGALASFRQRVEGCEAAVLDGNHELARRIRAMRAEARAAKENRRDDPAASSEPQFTAERAEETEGVE